MRSARARMWDPRPPSKHADVTAAAPAKRITFYRSGDSQFGGVRMAVHKRSFKCFDTLLDDLSQKVPLPFGVRTVTTPRGTHTIQHLEQLRDGGCYLCSDRRQAKPIDMELASRRPSAWYHHGHGRPRPPETPPPPGRQPLRQRRILLVRNGEPGTRRSVTLSRRSARSLRAFLNEASEVMQFHVRKLYTADGRRVDSVGSLMTCPGVLVCVGREALSPTLASVAGKSSEEKLPTLGSKSPGLGPRTPGNGARSPATQGARSPPRGSHSRASEYSEGHESKKNVNFGLETKKSIIHPRSDSSNRSARLSMSSEKSRGVSACSQARPGVADEDVEKRVLVNKDGSLSLEMRVRFRLKNDVTLRWSTQVRRSPSLSNECGPLSQAQSYYQRPGQSESGSDPDSTSFDSGQPLQRVSEGRHCPCCYQRQEHHYDLWENPAHGDQQSPVPPPHASSHAPAARRHTHSSSSSSSSCHSMRVVRCRARLSDCSGGDALVREEVCVTERVERRVEVERDGDTRVEVCRVSRCCSRGEVVAVDSGPTPLDRKSVEEELTMGEAGERPTSAISSSSNVLQSLKEDQDDDLSFAASPCHRSNGPSPTLAADGHLNGKLTGDATAGSRHSTGTTREGERGGRAASAASSCRCGAAAPHSASSRAKIQTSEDGGAADDEDEAMKRVASGLSGQTGRSAGSLRSGASSVCLNCGGCECEVDSVSNSRASQRSLRSHRASPKPTTPLSRREDVSAGRGDGGSRVSRRSSAASNVLEGRASSVASTTAAGNEEERAPSAKSATSHRSARSPESGVTVAPDVGTREEAEGQIAADGAPASPSAKSGASSKTVASAVTAASPTDGTAVEESDANERIPRPDSVRSAESKMSAKSGTSRRSALSHGANAVSPAADAADEPVIEIKGPEGGIEAEDRAASAISAKSSMSAKSNKSDKSTKASERSRSPKSGSGGDLEKMAGSQMSDTSNISVKSSKTCSHKPISPNDVQSAPPDTNVVTGTPVSVDGEGNDGAERATSAASAKSRKSNVSSASAQKSSRSRAAGVVVVEGDADERAEQQLAPGPSVGETRGLSALSVHSFKSSKSGGSKCRCGGASQRKAKEEDDAAARSEEAFSSSSTKRQGRESGGTERPLSRKSSGSVSLGLPEDQETAESDTGESSVSCRINAPRVKTASSDVSNSTGAPITRGNVEGTASALSQKSNKNGGSVGLSPNPPAVDVPTINTPDESSETVRAAGASSAKSGRSHRSSCSCGVKADGHTPEKGSAKSDPAIKASTPSSRASSAKSSASSDVCRKSPASGSVKKATKTTPGDSASETGSASKARGEEDIAGGKEASVHAKSPCCLKPESAASAQSDPSSPIKGQKAESRGSVKASRSEKKEKEVKSPSPCLLHSSRPHSRARTCSESTLSQTLSAADLLKEAAAAERPRSGAGGEPRSERTDPGPPALTPAGLPNASPSEVVSDWLRSIPADGSMLGLGDELREEEEETAEEIPGGEVAKEEESPEGEAVGEGEAVEAGEGRVREEGECDAAETTPRPEALLLSGESRPRKLDSSAAVMKVLLSSSMGRCRSLPEVSPVYGRRLSTSARGFLDCLAQLQLIEPAVGPERKSHQYGDVMAILQSLWLTEPRDGGAKEPKDVGAEQVSPPRSSSGVDMSSGSGSGKENAHRAGGGKGQNKTSDAESLREDEGATRVAAGGEEEGNAEEGDKDGEAEGVELERGGDQTAVPPSPENLSSPDKGSAHSSSKSPTDNERETPEDSGPAAPSAAPRAPVSKRPSQDPDPVWLLQLLKKLERQFMEHYSGAMAEFKVRWALDDSVVLDTMISELRDEVSRRIQSSVEREMRKIHGRAGRAGRPPQPPKGGGLSRESTMTEKRRRMLRVMKNQSVKTAESLSDGETAGDFSDQRSDDEYCPCDACVRKKMAARPLKVNPLAAEAPVMMEFDLLKILQLKKSPAPSAAPPPPEGEGGGVAADKEGRSLVAVREEEVDETKEDLKACVVLEETIPEEDEDTEREDGGEAGGETEVEVGGKEQGVGETDGEEGEAGEARCHCQCATNEEEEGDKAGAGEDAEPGGDGEEGKEDDDAAQNASKEEELTEGEEVDAEDSDTNSKRPSDTGVGEGETEKGRGGDGDEEVAEDNVEEMGPEEGEVDGSRGADGALLHQFTRTSVESQPGSMEDIDPDSPPNPVNSMEVPKTCGGGGGAGQRRSRSPARVKRRKPKESDEELDF